MVNKTRSAPVAHKSDPREAGPRRRSSFSMGGGLRRGQWQLTWLALVPAILFYLVFRYYPVVQTLVLSLTNAQLLRPASDFVGLDNFVTLFADSLFRKIIWNTSYYALATTAVTTVLALILALIMEPIQRLGGALRLIYYLPTITSLIAIATMWSWLYQPRFGLFNQVLGALGIPPINWLTSVEWAMPSIIFMSIWGGVGFSSVIFVAGLRGLPGEYTDAAVVDGASSLQIAWFVKLPLLSRVISFVVITGSIGSFQVFQQVYLLTRGGPLDATRVMALHIFEYAFRRLQVGEAAAMSTVLFAIVGILTILQLRLQRNDWAH